MDLVVYRLECRTKEPEDPRKVSRCANIFQYFHLRRFSENRSSSGSTPSVRSSVRPSVHPSVRPSVRPSVCLSVCPSVRNTLGCQVICNSKSFHSFLFKLCLMIVHILKMCTSYFVHVSYFFSYFFRGVELRHFFHPQCLGGA